MLCYVTSMTLIVVCYRYIAGDQSNDIYYTLVVGSDKRTDSLNNVDNVCKFSLN